MQILQGVYLPVELALIRTEANTTKTMIDRTLREAAIFDYLLK
jgi:hypothetical protein